MTGMGDRGATGPRELDLSKRRLLDPGHSHADRVMAGAYSQAPGDLRGFDRSPRPGGGRSIGGAFKGHLTHGFMTKSFSGSHFKTAGGSVLP